MKKLFLVLLLTLSVTTAFATREYHIKLCEDNYVIDITSWPTALPEYQKFTVNEELPKNVNFGFYQFNIETGLFELDEEKYQEYLDNLEEEETEE